MESVDYIIPPTLDSCLSSVLFIITLFHLFPWMLVFSRLPYRALFYFYVHWIQGIVIHIHLPYPFSFFYTYVTFKSPFPAQFLSWTPDPRIQLPAVHLHLLLKGKMGMYSGLSRQTFHKLSHNFSSSPIFPAAAAKSLQSCLTLCDPTDGSPLGSPIPGILQARTLEWVAISFSNAWKWKVKVKSLSCVWLLATPWTVAYQAPPSMGFSRQEYWSGVPLPSPPIFPNSIQLAKILPSISKEIAFSSPYVSLSWDLFQSTTPALFPSLPLFLPVRGRENYLIGEFGRNNIGYNQFPSSSILSCFLWHLCT